MGVQFSLMVNLYQCTGSIFTVFVDDHITTKINPTSSITQYVHVHVCENGPRAMVKIDHQQKLNPHEIFPLYRIKNVLYCCTILTVSHFLPASINS